MGMLARKSVRSPSTPAEAIPRSTAIVTNASISADGVIEVLIERPGLFRSQYGGGDACAWKSAPSFAWMPAAISIGIPQTGMIVEKLVPGVAVMGRSNELPLQLDPSLRPTLPSGPAR